jgi:hypothetical protein
MRRMPPWAIVSAALVVGSGARLWLATVGFNFDMESWWIVSEIGRHGGNVYAVTSRYNYGPLWAVVLTEIHTRLHSWGWVDIQALHLAVASVLTLVDVAIALTLMRVRDATAAVLFLLSPIAMLISGYHSQFDNCAVLLALWAWRSLPPASRSTLGGTALAGALLGLSLATKHVLLLLPLWILAERGRPLLHRLAFGSLAMVVFFAVFIPYVTTPEGWHGVLRHVFFYRGHDWAGNGLLAQLVGATPALPVFLAVVALYGVFVMRAASADALWQYLLAMVAFSPTITNQYLAIPLVSVAVYRRSLALWAYVILGTAGLLGSPDNVGALPVMEPIAAWVQPVVLRAAHDSPIWPQLCLVLFLVTWAARHTRVGQAVLGDSG